MIEFFRKNPQAVDSLRGPMFEEKVVDFVLELAKVTEQAVTPEELAREPERPRRRSPERRPAVSRRGSWRRPSRSPAAGEARRCRPDAGGTPADGWNGRGRRLL